MAKALITGHSGFKGTWLSKYLQMLGWEIAGYSLDDWSICPLDMEHILGDVRNFKQLSKTIDKVKPDIIFHLAAQPLVSIGYQQPKLTFETNVLGTLYVLEAANCPVLVITTDKVLANFNKDPYTASKIAAEAIANSYGAVTARSGNCLGGGDFNQDRIIPDMIRAYKTGKTLEIRRPHARRPFQHVLDALSGYIILGDKILSGEITSGNWNFGPIETHSVQDILDWWGFRNYTQVNPTFEEDLDLNLDSSESISKLGWQPVWDFPNTIWRTEDWYFRWLTGENPEKLIEEDIHAYQVWRRNL